MFNSVTLVGRVGRAEGKEIQGSYLLRMSLVTNVRYVDKEGERKEKSEWHNLVLFGKRAKALAPYISKGQLLVIQGMLQTRKWKDKDGNERSEAQVVVSELEILSRPAKTAGQEAAGQEAAGQEAAGEDNQDTGNFVDGDEIPF